jgi:CheY-like chemotaxis protein
MEKDCSGGACRSGRAAPNDDQRDAPEPTTWSRELAAQCRLVQGGCPVKVLIVEDDMIIATDLAAMIEEHGGIVVATTSDPARAVRLGLELYPDTVLMDVVLPGQTDGVDTAHFIRDLVGSTIVFCTASTDPETLRRMQAVDCSAIVQKPILSMELCQAIRRVMRKEKRT